MNRADSWSSLCSYRGWLLVRTKGRVWMDLCSWEASCAVHKPMQIGWDLVFVWKCKTLEVKGIMLLPFELVLKAQDQWFCGQKSSPQSLVMSLTTHSILLGLSFHGKVLKECFSSWNLGLHLRHLININRAVPSIAPVLLLLAGILLSLNQLSHVLAGLLFPSSADTEIGSSLSSQFHCDYFLLTLMAALWCKNMYFYNWKHHSNYQIKVSNLI